MREAAFGSRAAKEFTSAMVSCTSAALTAERQSSVRLCAIGHRGSKGRGERSAPGQLQLFVESTSAAMLNFGDNITVTPHGHLIVCEDQYSASVENHLRGVTLEGALYDFARLRKQTELAGACFSPDGRTMFVNVYDPIKTLAIIGPWPTFSV